MAVAMPLHPTASNAPVGACTIRGAAVVTARLSEVSTLARQPAPIGGPTIPPRFLRHADEQTVVGLQAVLQVVTATNATAAELSDDAVIGASCRAGQPTAARTMIGLEQQGTVGVTPHVVPQCSLHSLASAVSVALGMHGPNIGVAGGPQAAAEGFLAAATLVPALPASAHLWLVVTGWDLQPELESDGTARNDPTCRSLAVCFQPVGAHGSQPTTVPSLHITPSTSTTCTPTETAELPLWELCERLTQGRETMLACGHGLQVRLSPGENGFGLPASTARREAA
jgi:hypothetical protein